MNRPSQILIVEDEAIVARDVQRQLLELGYSPVEIAVDGEEAIRTARLLRPDLVLMDINLESAMDGIDAAMVIRGLGIPVVFLTAYATNEVVERAKAVRPSGYIIKPFDEQILHTTIEMALNQDRLDRQLRESESRYRAVIESAHDAIVTIDRQGRIVGWSAAATSLFGYTDEEIIGRPIIDLAPERERVRLADAVASHHDAATGPLVELEGLHKDGHECPVEFSIARWDGPNGWFVTAFIRDISTRRRSEEALRVAAAVIQNSPTVLFRWSGPGRERIDYVTQNVTRLFGHSYEALLASTFRFADLIHPDDVARVTREVAAHIDAGDRRCALEYRLVTATGEARWVDDRTAIERDADGRVTHFEGVLIDVTERKTAESSLLLQSTALNAAGNGIFITDSDLSILWVNRAFSTVSGYEPDEARGRILSDLLAWGAHNEPLATEIAQTVKAGMVWVGEVVNGCKNGPPCVTDLNLTPVRDDADQVTHIIGVQHDLTEQKRLQQQFLQAQKMEVVGRLAGGIAHDFNNLLTVINGTSDLALMSIDESDPVRTEFEEIRSAGERAIQLTKQLLAFSRKQVVAPTVVNVSKAVASSANMLRRLIGEDISLVINASREPAMDNVLIDAGQFEQVVLNLVVNAADAMPSGGTLSIGTTPVTLGEDFTRTHAGLAPGPHVLLAVTDTGSGMPPDVMARIFEPFFTTKGVGKGTGLGLATVYGIVTQAGGAIEVDSEPGRGTHFGIYLPLVSDASKPFSLSAPRATRGSETILLVEDAADLRALATRVLRAAGYTVIATADATEALTSLDTAETHVDLLFTDIIMPGMRGTELAVRAASMRQDLRVLFTSGYSDDNRLSEAVRADEVHFMLKPYSLVDLTNKVREVLDGPNRRLPMLTPGTSA